MDARRLDTDALRELIRRHKVYWEVRPEEDLDDADEVVKVGFQLGLRGTFEDDADPPLAGGPECVEVYRDLRTIAESLVPAGDADVRFELGGSASALDYTPSSRRQDVEVMIRIQRPDAPDGGIDEAERRSLELIERRLRELGVPEGRWREPPPG
jgi:hypothetical protein